MPVKEGKMSAYPLELSIDNSIKFERNGEQKICMEETEKTCKVLDCDRRIDFDNIEDKGTYLIRVEYDENNKTVEVRT